MTPRQAHLWAIGYDDPGQAERARAEVTSLAGPGQYLLLLDVAILARAVDGSYTLNRAPFPLTSNVLAGGTLGFLVGLALPSPRSGPAHGTLVRKAPPTVAHAGPIVERLTADVQGVVNAR